MSEGASKPQAVFGGFWHGPAGEFENCISFKYRPRVQIGKRDAILDPHMTNLITCYRAGVTSRLLNGYPDVADEPLRRMKRYDGILMGTLHVTKSARITWASPFVVCQKNCVEKYIP